MNRGLKHYTNQITQEVGSASCSVNINKEDANLHITLPLIQTLGLDPIDLSLIFNLQDYLSSTSNEFFGRGTKLNLYNTVNYYNTLIELNNADGSSNSFLSVESYFNKEIQMGVNVIYDENNILSGFKFTDKYGNFKEIDYGRKYPKLISMKTGATINTYLTENEPYITNNKGDIIKFNVDGNNHVTKVSYLRNNIEQYSTELEYSSATGYLSKIKYMNGTTLMSSTSLNITSTHIEVIDDISSYRIKYNLSSNRVSSFVDGINGTYSNGKYTSFEYQENRTNIVNFLGEITQVYFDSNGSPKYQINSKGDILETRYDDITKELLFQSNIINVLENDEQNLLGSDDIDSFTKSSGIACEQTSNGDQFLDETIGFSVYSVSSSSGNKTLSYVKNIDGIAGDELTLVLFGKQLTAYSTSTYVKVSLKIDNQEKMVRYFNKTNTDGLFDCITLGFSAKEAFSKIEILITLVGTVSIKLGGVKLLMKKLGSFYNYDESSNVSDIIYGVTSTNFSYNDSNLANQMISRDSSYNNFEYDAKGHLIKCQAAYGVKVENVYDSTFTDNLEKTTVSNYDESKILETETVYTEDGRFVNKKIDDLGNQTIYDLYDSFGRIKKVTDALNNVHEFDYYPYGPLKEIKLSKNSESSKAEYTYDSKRRLDTITLPNNSSYQFGYDNYDNITQVKLNGEVIFEYTYDPLTGNILTQKCGTGGGHFRFKYDIEDDTLLKTIYFIDDLGNQQERYSFDYDEKKRLKLVYDLSGNVLKNFIYNNDGHVTRISNNDMTIDNKYDNLGNVVSKAINVEEKKVYTSYDSISRSKGSHPSSLSLASNGYIGTFEEDSTLRDGDNLLPSIHHAGFNMSLPVSKEGVISYATVNSSNLMSYRLSSDSANPLECGCVQFWFKPTATSVDPDKMECLFSAKSTNGSGYIELMAEGGRLSLNVMEDSGNEHNLLSSDNSINYGQWNFVTLDFINRNDGQGYDDVTEYVMILNDEKQMYRQINPGLRLTLGYGCVYNIGHRYKNSSTAYCFNGKIACLRILPRDYALLDDIYRYRRLTKDYFIDNQLVDDDVNTVDFSQTHLFTTDSNIQEEFEIYPLQNNVESLNGLKPTKFKIRDISSLDKDRTFNFNKEIKSYAYVADGSELVYNFGQSITGTIFMMAYTDSDYDAQYFFEGKDVANHKLGLFRKKDNYVYLNFNGTIINTGLTFYKNEWHSISLSFDETIVSDSLPQSNDANIRVIVDDQEFVTTIAKTFSFGTMDVSIGRRIDYSTSAYSLGNYYDYSPLYGQIAMLATRTAYCEYDTINNLASELIGFTRTHSFDELGMLKRTELHQLGNRKMSNTYTYKTREDTRYLSKLVSKEVIKLGNSTLSTRNYTYDNLGRLTNVTDSKFGNHTYVYDYRGFLIKADGIDYSYDGNGNILSVGSKSFVYDANNKERLQSAGGLAVTTDNSGLIKAYNGKEFTYEGRRLTRVKINGNVTYQYLYDDRGLRIQKSNITNSKNSYYTYDGDRLVTEINDTCRLDFLYDEYGELYGFIKDGTDKYFYVRDVFKNILGIINSSGSIVVEYRYNPFGLSTSISGTLASTIGEINPFRYKGYYYDVETQLFYCNSRYYSPELCRFISPDSIEYLEPESINGLNLYCYCMNNPIMYADPSGHAPEWLQGLAIGLAIVGAVLVVGAITALTMGVGTTIMATTMAGAVIHGAAVGTLIGAGVGVVAGGIIGGAVSDWSADGILTGMGIGFGGGAIIGAVIGGSVGALQYTSAANSWLGGKEKMISHFNKHGADMGYKNVIQYTKGAKNVIKNGTYLAQKNAYYSLYQSGKYLFTGVGQGSNLITTFGIRSFTKTAAIALGLL